MIYYKIVNSTNLMTRIETPIPPSLLVPLLSVLNETELYSTWLPYYKKQFHLGVSSSNKLQQQNRVSQVIKVEVDVPNQMMTLCHIQKKEFCDKNLKVDFYF
mmetsp:Transcript_18531/g.23534  ORF Transcript_18531/g.23534 Transcript_18531/m.23534 type:complete len:102 (+) Transcript_18531:441-746(+)